MPEEDESRNVAARGSRLPRFLLLPTPLSRKETAGLLLIGFAILAYLLIRYGRFVDWGIW